jgi:hypothetical protein
MDQQILPELIKIIIASITGTGVISIGISSLISKMMNKYLSKRIDYEFETKIKELNSKIALNQEYIQKKRELYTNLIKSMRVFIEDTKGQIEEMRIQFLSSYDSCMLWASDEVIIAIDDYLDTQVQFTRTKDMTLQNQLKQKYGDCIIKMRNDCGLKKSELTEAAYRFFSF